MYLFLILFVTSQHACVDFVLSCIIDHNILVAAIIADKQSDTIIALYNIMTTCTPSSIRHSST
jgi:hypothetical protein